MHTLVLLSPLHIYIYTHMYTHIYSISSATLEHPDWYAFLPLLPSSPWTACVIMQGPLALLHVSLPVFPYNNNSHTHTLQTCMYMCIHVGMWEISFLHHDSFSRLWVTFSFLSIHPKNAYLKKIWFKLLKDPFVSHWLIHSMSSNWPSGSG